MDTKKKVASDKPFLTDTELFDTLMLISLVTKALAKKILLLPTDKIKEGGVVNG